MPRDIRNQKLPEEALNFFKFAGGHLKFKGAGGG